MGSCCCSRKSSQFALAWLQGGVQAGAFLPREDRRKAGSSGTPPPQRGAATNPKVPGSPGIMGTQTHAAQCAPPAYSMGKSACRTGQRGAYNR